MLSVFALFNDFSIYGIHCHSTYFYSETPHIFEPVHEKTNNLYMRKQRRRPASR